MAWKFPFGTHPTPKESISDWISDERNAPPKNPAEAASYYVYVIARQLLERETRPERRTQILRDFYEASREIVDAATGGATREEQAEILAKHRKTFELPEADFRKRKDSHGPTDALLLKEYEVLYAKLVPIHRSQRDNSGKMPIKKLKALVPKASRKKLRDAAKSAPAAASWILIGSHHNLGTYTIRNRISRARKRI